MVSSELLAQSRQRLPIDLGGFRQRLEDVCLPAYRMLARGCGVSFPLPVSGMKTPARGR